MYATCLLKALYLHQTLFFETRCPGIKAEFDELLTKGENLFGTLEVLVNLEEIDANFQEDTFSFILLGGYLAAFYYDFKLSDKFKKLGGDIVGVKVDFAGMFNLLLLISLSRSGYQNEGTRVSYCPDSRSS